MLTLVLRDFVWTILERVFLFLFKWPILTAFLNSLARPVRPISHLTLFQLSPQAHLTGRQYPSLDRLRSDVTDR